MYSVVWGGLGGYEISCHGGWGVGTWGICCYVLVYMRIVVGRFIISYYEKLRNDVEGSICGTV